MKINLAVLFGGKSVEHEISIISAVQAMENLNKELYTIFPVYITKNNEMYYGDALFDINNYKNINSLLEKCVSVDFSVQKNATLLQKTKTKLFEKKEISIIDVAIPIVHGTNVEDGTLQGYLNMKNIAYAGSDLLSSAIGMDKYVSKILLKNAGFPVLEGLMFGSLDSKDLNIIIEKIEREFSYPVIVKPINLGSSIGITKASDNIELKEALEVAYSYASRILIEPAVVNIKEINCSVLGDCDEAIPSICEEPVSGDTILSYEDKYISGGKDGESSGMASLKRKIPADISKETEDTIKDLATRAFINLGFSGVVRVDFIIDLDTNKIYINEFNTIPGSLSFYLWKETNLEYHELLDKLIKLALKRARVENSITYAFDTNVLSSTSFGSKGSKGKA
ncbi:MAG: D-alanine--D-alanine ligase family protein [Lachnospirales bacterium]